MSKTKISEYSATANSNTDVGGINIDEGCAPSGINDAIRTLMAQLKNFQTGTGGDSFNGPIGTTTPAAGAFTTLSATGVATFSAGSASAPALTTSGDTNTGVYFPAADTISLTTGGTERARVDSSGNLGLGVTPSAWTTYKAVQVGPFAAFADSTSGNIDLSSNRYSASGDKYIGSGYATMLRQSDGAFKFFTAASGTAGNAISFTQAMTLDASGNLGIGYTSPSTYGKLAVNGSIVGSNFNIQAGSAGTYGLADLSAAIQTYSGSASPANSLIFYTAGSERARIDSSGNVGFNTTSPDSGAKVTIQAVSGANGMAVKAGTNGNYGIYFNNVANSTVGGIIINSGAVAYNTTSDYRLKENIAPMTGALNKVALLKPCTYTWKADGSSTEGFIAHELAEVCPQAVSGEKDAVNEDGSIKAQGIDTSFLVATLTAAIQEQQAIIESLKARLDAANL